MDYIKQQQKHFDSIADKYFNERQSETSLLLKDLMWGHFFSDKDYLKSKTMVLEPMCGFGEGKKVIEKHLKSNIIYEGFDYSANIIAIAKKQDPDLNVYELNILDLNVKDKFDFVIVIGGLHHIYRDVDEILERIYNSLKIDGYFMCYEPTNNNFITRKIRRKIYKSNPLFDFETEQDFNLISLNKSFRQAKYSIVDQVYAGLLSYILFYNPDAFPQLNKGGKRLVRFLFSIDKLFSRNFIGKKLSFATLTLLKKDE